MMRLYIAKRLLLIIPTLFGILLLNFVVVQAAPGGPVEKTPAERIRDAILKEMGITEEDLAQMTPERRQGIEEEIAQRMQDKAIKTAEDRENRNA